MKQINASIFLLKVGFRDNFKDDLNVNVAGTKLMA